MRLAALAGFGSASITAQRAITGWSWRRRPAQAGRSTQRPWPGRTDQHHPAGTSVASTRPVEQTLGLAAAGRPGHVTTGPREVSTWDYLRSLWAILRAAPSRLGDRAGAAQGAA